MKFFSKSVQALTAAAVFFSHSGVVLADVKTNHKGRLSRSSATATKRGGRRLDLPEVDATNSDNNDRRLSSVRSSDCAENFVGTVYPLGSADMCDIGVSRQVISYDMPNGSSDAFLDDTYNGEGVITAMGL